MLRSQNYRTRPINVQDHLILGGGVAGLSLARMLCLNDVPFMLYEKHDSFFDNGLGFIIQENGLDAINKLKLLDDFKKSSCSLDEFILLNEKGAILKSTELKNSYGISRSAFINLLANSFPKEKVVFGSDIDLIQGNEGEPYKILINNELLVNTSGMIFAADGIKSKARDTVFKDTKLNNGRFREIVTFIRNKNLLDKIGNKFIKTQYSKGGLAFGILKCSTELGVCFFQYDCQNYECKDDDKQEILRFLKQTFVSWNYLTDSVLSNLDSSSLYHWYTLESKPFDKIHDANLILFGDAAHPLLPFTSQGVGAALDDAITFIETWLGNQAKPIDIICSDYYKNRKFKLEQYHNFANEMCKQLLLPEDQRIFDIPLAK